MHRLRPLLLLAATAAVVAPPSAGAQRRRSEREFRMDTTFAFAARGSADIAVAEGTLTVSTWDRSQVRVQVVSDDAPYELRASDSRFSLVPDSRIRGDSRIEITLPAGARLSVETHSGDVRVSRLQGDVQVQGQSGDVSLAGLGGRVDVRMISGDVTLAGVRGDVQVNAVSGDVDLTRLEGQLDVETVSGDITVRDASSKWVRLTTTSGDLTYAGDVIAGGTYELSAHSGDVTITLPQAPSARVSISTFNGEIDSDFPITLAPGDHEIGMGRSKRFNFELGRGDARVTLQSFNGDITLRGRGVTRSTR
ncbi:MAG: DUF4097 family beta strand repeat-containing protein [Gemmatimonadaceae bacterium]